MEPTSKIYETILLNRLEKFAADSEYFSELQFGFREGVGCIEASFTILETFKLYALTCVCVCVWGGGGGGGYTVISLASSKLLIQFELKGFFSSY